MKKQLDEATLAANEDFATDPLEIESDSTAATEIRAPSGAPVSDVEPLDVKKFVEALTAESDSTTATPEPEDGPKATEPEAVPATSYEAVNTYPESDPDAPSRLPPAARPCRAGP